MAVGAAGLDLDLPILVAIIERLGGRARSADIAAAIGPTASPHSIGNRLSIAARRRWVRVSYENDRSVWSTTLEGRRMLQDRHIVV